MNNNAFLEKLLQGAKVEWKRLEKVADYIRGVTYNKSNEVSNNEGYKILRANNITLSSNTINFDDIKTIRFDTKVRKDQKLLKNDILISAASGSREHVGKVAFVHEDLNYYFGGFMGVVRCNENINSRYIFYILTSDLFKNYLDEVLNTSTINNINAKVMNNFRVPIPLPPVQQEIVKTLDTLTALNNELAKELTLRQKQYQYYRDMLLNFKELNGGGYEVKWKTLGEVCDLQAGKHIPASKISPSVDGEHIYPCYGGNGVRGYVQDFSHNGNYIFIGRQGALCGNVQRYTGKLYATEHAVVVSCSNVIHPDYMFHLLTVMDLNQYASKSAQPGLVVGKLKDLKIPIPSIEEQYRIVEILDKFDTLTNSISEGLPKEIELRNKQYEYYREMLLGFERV